MTTTQIITIVIVIIITAINVLLVIKIKKDENTIKQLKESNSQLLKAIKYEVGRTR